MKGINELEFACSCGRKHKVLEWVSGYKLDNEWIWENLSADGVLRLSVPDVKCECDAEYIVDIEQGYVTVYDEGCNILYEEGYAAGRS